MTCKAPRHLPAIYPTGRTDIGRTAPVGDRCTYRQRDVNALDKVVNKDNFTKESARPLLDEASSPTHDKELTVSLTRSLLLGLALPLLTACSHTTSSQTQWLALPTLAHQLQVQPPLAVGFDVDDTLLFSTPCFYYGQQKYSPGSDEYLKNPAFWQETNGGCDRYSPPKTIARHLLAMHLARGDRLYFITGRPHTQDEQLSAILAQAFDLPQPIPVIFTSGPDKTRFIREHQLAIYYGDADSDIESARAAGARPIRVMRAVNSSYQPLPENGALGEDVLLDSDR